MVTTKYRELRSQYNKLEQAFQDQHSSPSRGFDELDCMIQMAEISKQMEAELDRIDGGEEQQKELIRQILNAYHRTRMAGTSAEDFILSHDSVRKAFANLNP